MTRYLHFIDGQAVEPASGEWFDIDNPLTGKPWAKVARGDWRDADLAVSAAQRALRDGPWSRMSAAERGRLLHRLGDLVSKEAAYLAELDGLGTGSPITVALTQIRVIAQWFHHFGRLAYKSEWSVAPVGRTGSFNIIRKGAIGVVASITPRKFPLLMAAWRLAPALAAGCTVVINPSHLCPISTISLASLLDRAGFPPGVVNVVSGFGSEVEEALLEHPLVVLIDLAGDDVIERCYIQAASSFKALGFDLGRPLLSLILEEERLDEVATGMLPQTFSHHSMTSAAFSETRVCFGGVREEAIDKINYYQQIRNVWFRIGVASIGREISYLRDRQGCESQRI
ncbi:aldehyde dehydrogenase family protein [Pseudomonas sp. CR3202]|uniref:aldehyde dehydrogenase family protein n=1 Tax=Pseudomonas sp. CR3202 TaxID=3351532 RepID=UPI003BF113E4